MKLIINDNTFEQMEGDDILFKYVNKIHMNATHPASNVRAIEEDNKLAYTGIDNKVVPLNLVKAYNNSSLIGIKEYPLYIEFSDKLLLDSEVWEGLPNRTIQIPNPEYISATYEDVEVDNPDYVAPVLDENGEEIEPAIGTPTIIEAQELTPSIGEPTLTKVLTFREWKTSNSTNPINENETSAIVRTSVGGFLNAAQRQVLFDKENELNNVTILGELEYFNSIVNYVEDII